MRALPRAPRRAAAASEAGANRARRASSQGRFWHQRTVVVDRVSKYVLDRIPECIGVDVEDAAMLDDADPDALEAALNAIYEPTQFGNET